MSARIISKFIQKHYIKMDLVDYASKAKWTSIVMEGFQGEVGGHAWCILREEEGWRFKSEAVVW